MELGGEKMLKKLLTFHVRFAIPGGLITGFVLVSMSRTKQKATKADKYIKSNLKLNGRNDTYLRTTTDKTKIKDD